MTENLKEFLGADLLALMNDGEKLEGKLMEMPERSIETENEEKLTVEGDCVTHKAPFFKQFLNTQLSENILLAKPRFFQQFLPANQLS